MTNDIQPGDIIRLKWFAFDERMYRAKVEGVTRTGDGIYASLLDDPRHDGRDKWCFLAFDDFEARGAVKEEPNHD